MYFNCVFIKQRCSSIDLVRVSLVPRRRLLMYVWVLHEAPFESPRRRYEISLLNRSCLAGLDSLRCS